MLKCVQNSFFFIFKRCYNFGKLEGKTTSSILSIFPFCNSFVRPNSFSIFKICQDYFLSNFGMAKGGFYAVARGRKAGIYTTWNECKQQVDGFTNARYKKFESAAEASAFIDQHSNSSTSVGGSFNKSTNTKTAVEAFHPKVSTTKKGVSVAHFVQVQPKATIQLAAAARSSNGLSTNKNVRKFSTTSAPDKRKLQSDDVGIITNKRRKTNDTPNARADLKEFQVDDTGYVVVYTDGACPRNGRNGAKAGIGVWFGDDHFLNVSDTVDGNKYTNNTAEIQAAVKAILQAKERGVDKLNIKTDSKFTINCATEWMNKWKRNNWKTATGQPVLNRTDLEKLDDAMNNMDIKWTHVAGHSGDPGNDAADKLAVEGANMKK